MALLHMLYTKELPPLLFDEAFATLPSSEEYTRDGVHPNEKGAEFIGSRYLEAITPLIREIANK